MSGTNTANHPSNVQIVDFDAVDRLTDPKTNVGQRLGVEGLSSATHYRLIFIANRKYNKARKGKELDEQERE